MKKSNQKQTKSKIIWGPIGVGKMKVVQPDATPIAIELPSFKSLKK